MKTKQQENPQHIKTLKRALQTERIDSATKPPYAAGSVQGVAHALLTKVNGATMHGNMLEEMQRRNEEKAKVLYDFLDSSRLFKGTVVPADRSLMNVPFSTGDKDTDAAVVAATKEAGFDNLKGHRSVGGLRASIYNAMPKEGVEALVAFLRDFEAKH